MSAGKQIESAAFTAPFSLYEVIESYVEILVVVLNRPAKFKLIKLRRLMSPIAQIAQATATHTGIGHDVATCRQ